MANSILSGDSSSAPGCRLDKLVQLLENAERRLGKLTTKIANAAHDQNAAEIRLGESFDSLCSAPGVLASVSHALAKRAYENARENLHALTNQLEDLGREIEMHQRNILYEEKQVESLRLLEIWCKPENTEARHRARKSASEVVFRAEGGNTASIFNKNWLHPDPSIKTTEDYVRVIAQEAEAYRVARAEMDRLRGPPPSYDSLYHLPSYGDISPSVLPTYAQSQ